MTEALRGLETWASTDGARAVTDADRHIGPALSNLRSCVLGNLEAAPRDYFSALSLLGREIALQSGSTSFALTEVDALAPIASGFDQTAARAALMEGYVNALLESGERQGNASWDPPACVVVLGDSFAAVAAGHPSADQEVLTAWADRVALCLVRARVRRVSIAGGPAALAVLCDALALVGIHFEAR